jgi:thiamine-phosphate pyrophosphorylase
VRHLPRGRGVLVILHDLPAGERRRLLRRLRGLTAGKSISLIDEARSSAARVHNIRELRRALLMRAPLILLSPIYPTRSHPDWQPIPLMRAAAFARLSGRRLFALGGMDERRFRRLSRLGFIGWAGIDAFRT